MSLVQITQEIVGQPYELGSCDCFQMIYDYIRRFTFLPEQWHGLLENYVQVYENDPHRAKDLIEQFLDEYLQSISEAYAFAGDILMLEHPDHLPFPAIHAGNRHFIAAVPLRGVAVLPLVNFKIKRAWRWQE